MAKGNDYEWKYARALSLWFTKGADRTQLIRSVQSGGWTDKGIAQVGDLAPNGPEGDEFRRYFAVEVKARDEDINLWRLLFTTEDGSEVMKWWRKINTEVDEMVYDEDHAPPMPIMILDKPRRTTLVMLDQVAPLPEWRRAVVIPRLEVVIVPFEEFIAVPAETYYERWF